MQAMEAQGCQFIVVTSWFGQFFRFTERRLKSRHVPYLKLFCVGPGKGTNERKLKVIKDEKIEIFVDSNKRIVEFMKRNSVKAVTSLDGID